MLRKWINDKEGEDEDGGGGDGVCFDESIYI